MELDDVTGRNSQSAVGNQLWGEGGGGVDNGRS